MKIDVTKIVPNPEQPRLVFDESEIAELADSIRVNGLIYPITVEEGDGCYILIDGERRLRAHKKLGLAEIEAVVRPSKNGQSAIERAILALVANIQRKDLNPVEEALAYKKLHEAGMSVAAIAHRIGVSGPRITSRLAILDLPEETLDLFAARKLHIDRRVTEAILSVPQDMRIEFSFQVANRAGITIKGVQEAAKKLNNALAAKKVDTDEPAMYFAVKRSGTPDMQGWNALKQIKSVPPWLEVKNAANKTCSSCVLKQEASEVVCGSCPVVVILTILIRKSHDGH